MDLKNMMQDSKTTTFHPGQKIGRYEVIDVLGIGGQGVVYRCKDPILNREVAIKHIATHLIADPAYRDRAMQNLINLARLGEKSDAIVTIHDIFENEQGLFYVMELVEGYSLEFLIQEAEGPVEPRAMLLILFRLAGALHDVHTAGIVHRDIKPSNIVMATNGDRKSVV